MKNLTYSRDIEIDRDSIYLGSGFTATFLVYDKESGMDISSMHIRHILYNLIN